MYLSWTSLWFRYGVAGATVALAMGLAAALRPFSVHSPFLLLVTAIALSAWHGGRGPALVAIVLSGLVLQYWFLPPLKSLALGVTGALHLGVFLLVALLISWLNTARQQAQAELSLERLFNSAVVDTLGAMLVVLDVHGCIVRLNSPGERIGGYSSEEAVGKPLWNLFLLPEQAPEVRALLQQVHTDHSSQQVSWHWRTRAGSYRLIACSLTALPVGGWPTECILLTGIDVTEQRHAQEELVRTREQLRLAHEVQRKLFPGQPPLVPGFDLGGATYPAAATGGDYFDFIPLATGRLGIVIGDVSGHGFGPALVMAQTRAYLRAFVLAHSDSAEILRLLNQVLAEDTAEDHFVTLVLTQLEPGTRSLWYASAGHLPGYVLTAQGKVRAMLQSTGPPLGILASNDFSNGEGLILQPGEMVLLLTDGVIEACDPEGTPFGTQRALDVVRCYRADEPDRITENLYHAVRAFCQNEPQRDDITAVILKVGSPSTGENRLLIEHGSSKEG